MFKIETREKFGVASMLSLVAGILILVNAVTSWIWHLSYFPPMWMMGSMVPIVSSMFMIGIVSGAMVLLGAFMMSARPSEGYKWGVIVLVFSILSFFGMSGFLIGAVLGIVGGILAIAKH